VPLWAIHSHTHSTNPHRNCHLTSLVHPLPPPTATAVHLVQTVHFMQSTGLDGMVLDLEGPLEQLTKTNATLREGLTYALAALKTKMEEVVPGSVLGVDVAPTGEPFNSPFTPDQFQTIIHNGVDRFLFMFYGYVCLTQLVGIECVLHPVSVPVWVHAEPNPASIPNHLHQPYQHGAGCVALITVDGQTAACRSSNRRSTRSNP
jgi:hypothetical protein